jgi:hypothetical protein
MMIVPEQIDFKVADVCLQSETTLAMVDCRGLIAGHVIGGGKHHSAMT